MKNILSEIYHGSYDVLKRKDRKGTAFAATLNRMNELEAEIRKALPDDAKDAFDAYIQAQADLADMACEEDFISGYQLGVQMLLAGIDHQLLHRVYPVEKRMDFRQGVYGQGYHWHEYEKARWLQSDDRGRAGRED